MFEMSHSDLMTAMKGMQWQRIKGELMGLKYGIGQRSMDEYQRKELDEKYDHMEKTIDDFIKEMEGHELYMIT